MAGQTQKRKRKVMNKRVRKTVIKAFLLLSMIVLSAANSPASLRILEFEFRLSPQINSEFSTKFAVFSAGKITLEASCPGASTQPSRLRLVLIRPDKTEIKSEGSGELKVEHSLTIQELDGFVSRRATQWAAKIIYLENTNEKAPPVIGTLKITVPAESRTLEDSQFTLQGFRNAQSIPFKVQGPGRLVVDVSWQAVSGDSKELPPLTLSLIHESQNRIYANKTGTRHLRLEHQVSEQDLDRGNNWSVKILNNAMVSVRGKVTITYTPSL
jgi:hypothetical protein